MGSHRLKGTATKIIRIFMFGLLILSILISSNIATVL